MRHLKRCGFTLIELMIVVSIIAIIAAMAIPMFLRNRMAAYETSAIVNMKRFAIAQSTLRTANDFDTNKDGTGEYGNFTDLCGRNPLFPFDPTYLEKYFQQAIDSGYPANGPIPRLGYLFELYSGQQNFKVDAADALEAANSWWATAYPIQYGKTGVVSFYINEQGVCRAADLGVGGAGATGYADGLAWTFRPG